MPPLSLRGACQAATPRPGAEEKYPGQGLGLRAGLSGRLSAVVLRRADRSLRCDGPKQTCPVTIRLRTCLQSGGGMANPLNKRKGEPLSRRISSDSRIATHSAKRKRPEDYSPGRSMSFSCASTARPPSQVAPAYRNPPDSVASLHHIPPPGKRIPDPSVSALREGAPRPCCRHSAPPPALSESGSVGQRPKPGPWHTRLPRGTDRGSIRQEEEKGSPQENALPRTQPRLQLGRQRRRFPGDRTPPEIVLPYATRNLLSTA